MDISLDTYKTYYYVCQLRNLTKAAEVLYVTQPAITKQIKKLEESLGKSLIIRSTKGIELTNEGQLLYSEIKNHIESILALENTFREKVNNYEINFRIIAGHFTMEKIVLPAMVEFSKMHPNVKFEMSTYPANQSIQKLRRNEADLIFISKEELTESYNDILVKDVLDLHDIFVVSENSYKKFPKTISILDLNNFHTITKLEGSVGRLYIDEYFKKAGQKFSPRYQLCSYWLVNEYIKNGLGIGLGIKEYIQQELENGTLVQIQTKEEIPPRKLVCAMQKNGANYSIVKEFLKEIKA